MNLSFPHSRLTNEYKICCSHEKEFNNYRAKSLYMINRVLLIDITNTESLLVLKLPQV